MKAIFDSDLLGDDFFALSAIVDNPEVELLGICSFGRITTSLNRARMAQVFLEEKGKTGLTIVPGANHPLLQPSKNGCLYCNNELMALLNGWNPKKKYSNAIIDNISAAEYIASVLRRERGVTLLCTGPLTNIALAYSIAPEIVESVDSIVVMAGVHYIQGNKSPVAESNVFNDVDSARIVFETFKNIVMIPLDVTLQFSVREEDLDDMQSSFFREVSLSCCKSHLDRGDESIMPMHDYLAYLAMIDPTLLEYKRCNVSVDNYGNRTRGMLIFDWREDGRIQYAINLDKERCMKHYREDFTNEGI